MTQNAKPCHSLVLQKQAVFKLTDTTFLTNFIATFNATLTGVEKVAEWLFASHTNISCVDVFAWYI
jgi:hypothetical protein